MNRLVIDDWREFTFADDDDPEVRVVYARTNAKARTLLFNEQWDEVWFDHDMGLPVSIDAILGMRTAKEIKSVLLDATTYPLAVEIEMHPERYSIGRVFVHTGNPVGAERLMWALRAFNPQRVMIGD